MRKTSTKSLMGNLNTLEEELEKMPEEEEEELKKELHEALLERGMIRESCEFFFEVIEGEKETKTELEKELREEYQKRLEELEEEDPKE